MFSDSVYSPVQKRVVKCYYVSPRDASTSDASGSSARGAAASLTGGASIQQALQQAEPYSRIILANGQYFEMLSITRPIEIVADEGCVPEIINRGTCITVSQDVECFFQNIRFVSKTGGASSLVAGGSAMMMQGAASSIRVTAGSPSFVQCECTSVFVGGSSDPSFVECKINGSLGCPGVIVGGESSGTYTRNQISNHIPFCVVVNSTGNTPQFIDNDISQSSKSIKALQRGQRAASEATHSGVLLITSSSDNNSNRDNNPSSQNNENNNSSTSNKTSNRSRSSNNINNVGSPKSPSKNNTFSKNNNNNNNDDEDLLSGDDDLYEDDQFLSTSPTSKKTSQQRRRKQQQFGGGNSNSNNATSASSVDVTPIFKGNMIRDDVVDSGLGSATEFQARNEILWKSFDPIASHPERMLIRVDAHCSPSLVENSITGGVTCLAIMPHARGSYIENTISKASLFGVSLGHHSNPVFQSNTVCDCSSGVLSCGSRAKFTQNIVRDNRGTGLLIVAAVPTHNVTASTTSSSSSSSEDRVVIDSNAFIANDTGILIKGSFLRHSGSFISSSSKDTNKSTKTSTNSSPRSRDLNVLSSTANAADLILSPPSSPTLLTLASVLPELEHLVLRGPVGGSFSSSTTTSFPTTTSFSSPSNNNDSSNSETSKRLRNVVGDIVQFQQHELAEFSSRKKDKNDLVEILMKEKNNNPHNISCCGGENHSVADLASSLILKRFPGANDFTVPTSAIVPHSLFSGSSSDHISSNKLHSPQSSSNEEEYHHHHHPLHHGHGTSNDETVDYATIVEDFISRKTSSTFGISIINSTISRNIACGIAVIGSVGSGSLTKGGGSVLLKDLELSYNGLIGVYASCGALPLCHKLNLDRGNVGILSEKCAKPLVVRCTFMSQQECGVFCTNRGHGFFTMNTFGAFRLSGFHIEDGSDPTLLKNQLRQSAGAAIRCSRGGMGKIEENHIEACSVGVDVLKYSDPLVSKNFVANCLDNGFLIHDNGAGTFVSNKVEACRIGVTCFDQASPTFRDNAIVSSSFIGIHVGKNCDPLIEKNTIGLSQNGANIMIEGAKANPSIRGNRIIKGKQGGIQSVAEAEGIVSRNHLEGNGESALSCGYSGRTLFRHNRIVKSCDAGIVADTNSRSHFLFNVVELGTNIGIIIRSGSASTFRSCTVRQNEGFGVALCDGAGGEISDCTIEQNGEGGLYVLQRRANVLNCLIRRLNFKSNKNRGLLLPTRTQIQFRDCVFEDHRVGADLCDCSRRTELRDCIFRQNEIGIRASSTSNNNNNYKTPTITELTNLVQRLPPPTSTQKATTIVQGIVQKFSLANNNNKNSKGEGKDNNSNKNNSDKSNKTEENLNAENENSEETSSSPKHKNLNAHALAVAAAITMASSPRTKQLQLQQQQHFGNNNNNGDDYFLSLGEEEDDDDEYENDENDTSSSTTTTSRPVILDCKFETNSRSDVEITDNGDAQILRCKFNGRSQHCFVSHRFGKGVLCACTLRSLRCAVVVGIGSRAVVFDCEFPVAVIPAPKETLHYHFHENSFQKQLHCQQRVAIAALGGSRAVFLKNKLYFDAFELPLSSSSCYTPSSPPTSSSSPTITTMGRRATKNMMNNNNNNNNAATNVDATTLRELIQRRSSESQQHLHIFSSPSDSSLNATAGANAKNNNDDDTLFFEQSSSQSFFSSSFGGGFLTKEQRNQIYCEPQQLMMIEDGNNKYGAGCSLVVLEQYERCIFFENQFSETVELLEADEQRITSVIDPDDVFFDLGDHHHHHNDDNDKDEIQTSSSLTNTKISTAKNLRQKLDKLEETNTTSTSFAGGGGSSSYDNMNNSSNLLQQQKRKSFCEEDNKTSRLRSFVVVEKGSLGQWTDNSMIGSNFGVVMTDRRVSSSSSSSSSSYSHNLEPSSILSKQKITSRIPESATSVAYESMFPVLDVISILHSLFDLSPLSHAVLAAVNLKKIIHHHSNVGASSSSSVISPPTAGSASSGISSAQATLVAAAAATITRKHNIMSKSVVSSSSSSGISKSNKNYDVADVVNELFNSSRSSSAASPASSLIKRTQQQQQQQQNFPSKSNSTSNKNINNNVAVDPKSMTTSTSEILSPSTGRRLLINPEQSAAAILSVNFVLGNQILPIDSTASVLQVVKSLPSIAPPKNRKNKKKKSSTTTTYSSLSSSSSLTKQLQQEEQQQNMNSNGNNSNNSNEAQSIPLVVCVQTQQSNYEETILSIQQEHQKIASSFIIGSPTTNSSSSNSRNSPSFPVENNDISINTHKNDNSILTYTQNIFTNIRSAAILIACSSRPTIPFIFTQNAIEGNIGVGIVVGGDACPSINDCVVHANLAGGVFLARSSNAFLNGNKIWQNAGFNVCADIRSGGIVQRCVFEDSARIGSASTSTTTTASPSSQQQRQTTTTTSNPFRHPKAPTSSTSSSGSSSAHGISKLKQHYQQQFTAAATSAAFTTTVTSAHASPADQMPVSKVRRSKIVTPAATEAIAICSSTIANDNIGVVVTSDASSDDDDNNNKSSPTSPNDNNNNNNTPVNSCVVIAPQSSLRFIENEILRLKTVRGAISILGDSSSDSACIENNKFSNCNVALTFLLQDSSIKVKNNKFLHCSTGVKISDGAQPHLTDMNYFEKCDHGIILDSGACGNISTNMFSHNACCIEVHGPRVFTIISKNKFTSNRSGITFVRNSPGLKIEENLFEEIEEHGIVFTPDCGGSNGVLMVSNEFRKGRGIAIQLGGSSPSSDSTTSFSSSSISSSGSTNNNNNATTTPPLIGFSLFLGLRGGGVVIKGSTGCLLELCSFEHCEQGVVCSSPPSSNSDNNNKNNNNNNTNKISSLLQKRIDCKYCCFVDCKTGWIGENGCNQFQVSKCFFEKCGGEFSSTSFDLQNTTTAIHHDNNINNSTTTQPPSPLSSSANASSSSSSSSSNACSAAAILVRSKASGTFSDIEIRSCSSGIICLGPCSGTFSKILVKNCMNGVVFCGLNCTPTMTQCAFGGNYRTDIDCSVSALPTVSHCSFTSRNCALMFHKNGAGEFKHLYIRNAGVGCFVGDQAHPILLNSVLYDCETGLLLTRGSASGGKFENLWINCNDAVPSVGIRAMGQCAGTVTKCLVENCGYGILAEDNSSMITTFSTIRKCARTAVFIVGHGGSLFSSCSVTECHYGVQVVKNIPNSLQFPGFAKETQNITAAAASSNISNFMSSSTSPLLSGSRAGGGGGTSSTTSRQGTSQSRSRMMNASSSTGIPVSPSATVAGRTISTPQAASPTTATNLMDSFPNPSSPTTATAQQQQQIFSTSNSTRIDRRSLPFDTSPKRAGDERNSVHRFSENDITQCKQLCDVQSTPTVYSPLIRACHFHHGDAGILIRGESCPNLEENFVYETNKESLYLMSPLATLVANQFYHVSDGIVLDRGGMEPSKNNAIYNKSTWKAGPPATNSPQSQHEIFAPAPSASSEENTNNNQNNTQHNQSSSNTKFSKSFNKSSNNPQQPQIGGGGDQYSTSSVNFASSISSSSSSSLIPRDISSSITSQMNSFHSNLPVFSIASAANDAPPLETPIVTSSFHEQSAAPTNINNIMTSITSTTTHHHVSSNTNNIVIIAVCWRIFHAIKHMEKIPSYSLLTDYQKLINQAIITNTTSGHHHQRPRELSLTSNSTAAPHHNNNASVSFSPSSTSASGRKKRSASITSTTSSSTSIIKNKRKSSVTHHQSSSSSTTKSSNKSIPHPPPATAKRRTSVSKHATTNKTTSTKK